MCQFCSFLCNKIDVEQRVEVPAMLGLVPYQGLSGTRIVDRAFLASKKRKVVRGLSILYVLSDGV